MARNDASTGVPVDDIVKKVALKVFTEQQLMEHSVTGQESIQCKGTPRPGLDQELLNAVRQVIWSAFPGHPKTKIHAAISRKMTTLRAKEKGHRKTQ